jgi:hypothetical protein
VIPAFRTIDRKEIFDDREWGMNDEKWSKLDARLILIRFLYI